MTLLVAAFAAQAIAGDRPPPPGLPLAQWWSEKLDGAVSSGPVSAGSRVYLALSSAHLTARGAADGKEIWKQDRSVTLPMAAAGDLLFVASGDAIDALQGATGKTVWTLPRATPTAPMVVHAAWLIVTTETDLIALEAATGKEVWRRAAGSVKLPPVVDGDQLYAGAQDGRVLALSLKDGSVAWQEFVPGGVTAIAAYRGRVYAGAGDKILYCLDARKGEKKWPYSIGAYAAGRIAVDDKHVYVAAINNIVRALDRQSGNQRWLRELRQRPVFGVYLAGHVVFVPSTSTDLAMMYDHDGLPSGTLSLPGERTDLPPSINETPAGTVIYAVTGTLTNEWVL